MKKIKLVVAISFMAIFSACTNDAFENDNNATSQRDPITIDPDPNPDPTIPVDPVLGDYPTNIYTLKVNPDDGAGIGLLLNGEEISLEVPANYAQISNSVYVDGNDVYVVGAIYDNSNPSSTPNIKKAVVWKNGFIHAQYGIVNSFGRINAEARSMLIYNGDMYVVGYDQTSFLNAAVWKNGVETILPSGGNDHCIANSIAVNNSNVCILGQKYNAPALWTNGSLAVLPNLTTGSDIAILGNYAYIVGSQLVSGKIRARKLTKSLITGSISSVFLSQSTTEGEAEAITVDQTNSIIYISGTEARPANVGGGKRAVIWKNGISTTLSENGYAGDLATFNGHVYVCGGQNNQAVGVYQQRMQNLWINDNEEYYDGFDSHTKSIALQ